MRVTLKILILAYKMYRMYRIYMLLYLLKFIETLQTNIKKMLREKCSLIKSGLFRQSITVFIGQKWIFNACPIYVSAVWTMRGKVNVANIVENAHFYHIRKPLYFVKFSYPIIWCISKEYFILKSIIRLILVLIRYGFSAYRIWLKI